MTNRTSSHSSPLDCLFCGDSFPPEDVYFVCVTCRQGNQDPLPEQGDRWRGSILFKPGRVVPQARCPQCHRQARTRVCPTCWAPLPSQYGKHKRIVILGPTNAGKTCYMVGLVRHVRMELSRRGSYEMSIVCDGDSQQYFQRLEESLYIDSHLPQVTAKDATRTAVEFGLRFPVRGWLRRLRKGRTGQVSILLYNPTGEYYETRTSRSYLRSVSQAGAIILAIDPMEGATTCRVVRDPSRAVWLFAELINGLRHELDRQTGPLDPILALTVTKCDQLAAVHPKLRPFLEERRLEKFPYDATLAAEASQDVQMLVWETLGMGPLVELARRSFRRVGFFATASLGMAQDVATRTEHTGETGLDFGAIAIREPWRVEEPLLWILHEFGYF